MRVERQTEFLSQRRGEVLTHEGNVTMRPPPAMEAARIRSRSSTVS